MNFKQTVIYFVLIFVITFVVSADGAGVVDWETAFTLAVILGIVLTGIRFQEQKRLAGREDKV